MPTASLSVQCGPASRVPARPWLPSWPTTRLIPAARAIGVPVAGVEPNTRAVQCGHGERRPRPGWGQRRGLRARPWRPSRT